jgi:GMP synthase-like glutamine amidotransferase
VRKSDKGWGIGLHTYGVAEHPGWMDASPGFSLAASHQDQVLAPPPGATLLAGSDFCPHGMLAYDETSISCQLHPEFAPGYSIALVEGRKGQRFAEAEADAAIESLHRPDDHARFADWVARFLAG